MNGLLKAALRGASLCLLAATALPAVAADKVRVGIVNASSDVVYFIAEKKGYFAAENIEPDFVSFTSATQMIAPLGTGELDVGGGGPSAGLYNAAERKIDMKVVADKGSMPPGYGYFSLLVRKDLVTSGKVKTVADLKGLKIGDTSKQGSGDVTLAVLLKRGGLKFEDVDPYYMGAPQLAVALQNGALDATLIQEPSLSLAVSKGAAVLFAKGDEIYPNQQLAVTFFSEKLTTSRRELAQRFMNAYVRAARFYNDALKDGRLAGPNANEVIDLLVEKTALKDRDIYAKMVPNGLNPDGCANVEGLRNDFEFYVGMGWAERKIDPDSLVDSSFCKAAVAKLGPYVKAK
jgi:NitT/TauT family transport system substrate-binding protein